MDLHERLAEFFRRLQAMDPSSKAEESLSLVCRLIEEVEDELCPVPRENPPPFRFTGRMYAPQRDRVFVQEDGGLVAETRRHRIFCHQNGGIRVEDADTGRVILVKEGKKL